MLVNVCIKFDVEDDILINNACTLAKKPLWYVHEGREQGVGGMSSRLQEVYRINKSSGWNDSKIKALINQFVRISDEGYELE